VLLFRSFSKLSIGQTQVVTTTDFRFPSAWKFFNRQTFSANESFFGNEVSLLKTGTILSDDSWNASVS
jgi:hypothetical protein